MTTVLHVGDCAKFLATIVDEDESAVDISGASEKKLIFKRRGGTASSNNATLNGDGSDGKMYYQADTAFLDTKGTWEWQAKVVISSKTYYSNIKIFEVRDIIS